MTMIKKLTMLAGVALALCLVASLAFGCFCDYKTVPLCAKDPNYTGCIAGGASGTLTYSTGGPKFDFHFMGSKLTPGASYTLIYYPDPWPGTNLVCLATGKAGTTGWYSGTLSLHGSLDLNSDLPIATDANYPTGAKIWLVLTSDVDCTNHKMTAWQQPLYLFETKLITYQDSDLSRVLDAVKIETIPGPPATVDCGGMCISFYPEQPGVWGGNYPHGAVTAFPGDNDTAGYVILNVGGCLPESINISHLDGIADDSFDVFVLDADGNWAKLGHYEDNGLGTETWIVTNFPQPSPPINVAGPNGLIKIVPTGAQWSGFGTWGQLAIDKVELVGKCKCN